jgi:Ulp1 family protease
MIGDEKKNALLKKINSIDLSVKINDNVTLFYTDFFALKPEHYLTDRLINAFTAKLQKTTNKKHYFFDTMFMYTLEEEDKELGDISSWTHLFHDYEKVFIPILNYKKTHWVLVVVDMMSRTIVYYDSALTKKNKSGEKYLTLTKDFLEKVSKETITFQTMTYEKTPQQNNVYDCGVYVCAIMKCICEENKELKFSPDDMRYHMMELFLE